MKKFKLFLLFLSFYTFAQAQQYTRQDSLRGKLSLLRNCYDVFFYDLTIRVEPEKKFIKGYNSIHYTCLADFDKIQIDLFDNMQIEKIIHQKKELNFVREGNATFVKFNGLQKKGKKDFITIYYSGNPRPAVYAPWDGGFSWKKDKNNNHWIAVSCEGIGASLWWPNKDHLSEEPDSMRISCEVPTGLKCIANGNLRKESNLKDNYTRFDWFVSYPINNYNVTLNIGKYAQFSDTYTAEDGDKLSLDYYVMDYNVDLARKQFEQVKPMLQCYEKLFGKYPFWKDGFALVETPYLGMEHQGAIAYGNQYKQGYLGMDRSATGIGLLFDYIIIHEVGHEYWGNSVSCKDHAELWIHESFCTYTEGLYVECLYGKEKGAEYLMGLAHNISNSSPIIGDLEVNGEGSNDMYDKGAVMLHTLRNVLDDDKLWFEILKGISTEFKIRNTDTKEIISYINRKTGKDYTRFFDQYLRQASPPTLLYQIIKDENGKKTLEYSWQTEVKDFQIPIKILLADGSYKTLTPTKEKQKIELNLPKEGLKLKEKSFYILLKNEK